MIRTQVGLVHYNGGALIGAFATLRRRSVPSLHHNEPENRSTTWKSVTHVPRLFCYLSPRPLRASGKPPAARRRMTAAERQDLANKQLRRGERSLEAAQLFG